MHDRLRLDCKREGLFRSLMRFTRDNNVSVVVTWLSRRVGRVVSADRYMGES